MSLRRRRKQEQTTIEKSATAKAGGPASEDPGDATRRLSNIRPREVSLVDSAANGHTFLLVKNKAAKDKTLFKGEEEEPKAEEQTPAEEPAASEAPAAKDDGEKKPAPAPEPEPEAEPAAASAEDESSSGEEEESPDVEVEKHFILEAEKILERVPVSKALAMEQKDMFLAMSDAMMSIALSMDMIRSDLMAFAGSDGKTGFMGLEVVKGLSKTEIEKRGKKMRKTRLSKLKTAVESLNTLLKELEDESENVKKGGSTMTTKKDEKTVEEKTTKSAAGNAPATEDNTSETETKKEAAKAEAAPAVEAEAKPLTKADLDEAVEKATKPLKEEIEALKNKPADSAAEGAEDSEDVEKSETETKKSLWSNVIF